jgi:hypothetical protein
VRDTVCVCVCNAPYIMCPVSVHIFLVLYEAPTSESPLPGSVGRSVQFLFLLKETCQNF